MHKLASLACFQMQRAQIVSMSMVGWDVTPRVRFGGGPGKGAWKGEGMEGRDMFWVQAPKVKILATSPNYYLLWNVVTSFGRGLVKIGENGDVTKSVRDRAEMLKR